MAVQLVTCGKCRKVFDYEKTSGICPKCARFYSKTSYNDEEAFLNNILSSSNEENCSYHGSASHQGPGASGHSEGIHYSDAVSRNAPINHTTQRPSVSQQPLSYQQPVRQASSGGGGATKPRNMKGAGIFILIYVILMILIRLFGLAN